MKKTLRALLLALAILLGVTLGGCSSGSQPTLVPVAAGQVINGVGRCYYLDDPYEAQQMLADGRCPAGWIPTRAPLSWQEEYFAYYDSPAYYNVYVLPAHRTVYVHTETVFHTTYSKQITAAAKTAVYKTSTGKTVTGPSTAKLKFGSGSGSVGTMGGGSLRGGTSGSVTGGSKSGTGTTGGSKTTIGGTSGSRTSSGGISGGSLRGGRR